MIIGTNVSQDGHKHQPQPAIGLERGGFMESAQMAVMLFLVVSIQWLIQITLVNVLEDSKTCQAYVAKLSQSEEGNVFLDWTSPVWKG